MLVVVFIFEMYEKLHKIASFSILNCLIQDQGKVVFIKFSRKIDLETKLLNLQNW